MINNLLTRFLALVSLVATTLVLVFSRRAKHIKADRDQEKRRADQAEASLELQQDIDSDLQSLTNKQRDQQQALANASRETLNDHINSDF